MTLEERVLVSMYTRAVEARELIQTDLRLHEYIKDEDNQVLRLLATADESLFQVANALSRQVSAHTDSSHVQPQGPSARSEK